MKPATLDLIPSQRPVKTEIKKIKAFHQNISIIKKINSLFGRQPILIGRGKAGQNAVKKLFSEEVILSRFDQLFSQLIKK